MEDLIGALEVDAVVEEEMHAQQEEMELQRNFLWLERPDELDGCGVESESDDDDDPNRADPVSLGRVLEQLLDVV